jgi:chromosome segregation ATPase
VAVTLDLVEEEAAAQLEAPHRVVRKRRPQVALALALLVPLGVLVFVLGNVRQANTQYEQAHDALVQTKGRVAATEVELRAARQDLQFLKDQVSSSETALSADAALLQSVRAALAQAQTSASGKSTYIANLKTCQGGVQQALNALSVGDQNHAVSALNGVSTACQSAASGG